MKDRRTGDRRLVDGLDYHERLVRLEKWVFGDKAFPGMTVDVGALQERVETLESELRRRRMPRLVRWVLDWKPKAKR